MVKMREIIQRMVKMKEMVQMLSGFPNGWYSINFGELHVILTVVPPIIADDVCRKAGE
jgi:hypothetical protein